MIIAFTPPGWEDYQYWVKNDAKMESKLSTLIKDICRDPFKGLGKPEPLKNELQGWWSRRIDSEHRVVYRVSGEFLWINQCRFHYSK